MGAACSGTAETSKDNAEDRCGGRSCLGRLTLVLSDWCPPISGLFVYYPGRRQVPGPLRAFIEVLRERMP